MKKPKNLTLKNYWEANSSWERQEIVENTFKYLNFLEQKLNKLTNTKQCAICGVGSSLLKHTMTLGVTPITWFNNDKPNYQILNINYSTSDGKGDLVRVTLQVSQKVEVIKISTQEAVSLGFINPYGLKDYCK
ncbi:hypothetical protein Phi12:1_gp5 [Cellulophaga phage phi12:1]|uniref:Uncharacterized protein n=2 Tax=Cellulophaga phage phi12:1 TaxID=1327976 RepID=R9ZXU9_9CAUD|nr:hypothetical protein Phi12:1_gp5 [Cellulophaga phage phi12:1]AGO47971.1 hypothetical protein Phi12:1_gp5 [Cellulophaga phage phi12:1]AGO48136.1 hypothetical protein Phi12:3_gp5 [Cellulophaga phage phi12:3]